MDTKNCPSKYKIKVVFICITLLLFTNTTHADKREFHAHDDIFLTAETFIKDSIHAESDSTEIRVKPLDRRLRLARCPTPLQAFWPPGASQLGHTSVGIRCHGNKPWKIYIGANIKVFKEVWVSNTAISRGTILSESHVTLEKRQINHVHSEFFDHQSTPLGLMAKRPMRKGDIIKVLALEKPMAVQRGDRVIVIAKINGLEIRTAATALSAAAEGDQVRVRNNASNKELVGTLRKNSFVYVNI